MKKISKTKTKKEIENFFSEIKSKSPREIKKIKKIAMSQNTPLKEKRKLFCKKCFNPFTGKEKIRIKNRVKNVECLNCGHVNKWRIR